MRAALPRRSSMPLAAASPALSVVVPEQRQARPNREHLIVSVIKAAEKLSAPDRLVRAPSSVRRAASRACPVRVFGVEVATQVRLDEVSAPLLKGQIAVVARADSSRRPWWRASARSSRQIAD